jgi:tetratricopeptide (TPR) repeat protein
VDRLLREGEADLDRRPDAAAVAQARELFLAAAQADESRSESLLGAAMATAWLVEHEPDSTRRAALATAGVQTCQWCVRRFAESAECRYRLALALGQQARERPATAMDALPRIVALLEEVIATAPHLDEAGGQRVLALLLLRAPGWPAGPGDPDSGLEHARKAVELAPEYPPNVLTLGEALAATGSRDEARAAYRRAAELARSRAAAGDPDAAEWAKQAEAGIS